MSFSRSSAIFTFQSTYKQRGGNTADIVTAYIGYIHIIHGTLNAIVYQELNLHPEKLQSFYRMSKDVSILLAQLLNTYNKKKKIRTT